MVLNFFLCNEVLVYHCLLVTYAEVSNVSVWIFCIVDSCICNFPMDLPLLCFYVVNLSIPSLEHSFLANTSMIFNNFCKPFCRWPYPFLELSSPYAPLWYVVSSVSLHHSNDFLPSHLCVFVCVCVCERERERLCQKTEEIHLAR